jgi:signal transduction histidine kinase
VGRIITDLRPSILDHQGLWAALDWQAHEFVQSAELQLDWQMDVAQAAPINEQAAIGIFRIFQEMLSNVGRHARASAVAITLQADMKNINISVKDNGCGADPSAFEAANAYGVMGMRERARHLGGSIGIESQTGTGSTFHLHIQLLEQ